MFRLNGLRARLRSSRGLRNERRRKHPRGFTLLEVVVAFTCVALIIGAVLRIFSIGLRTSDVAEKRATGIMLAQSVLSQIEAGGPLSPRAAEGEFVNGYSWAYRIDPYVEADAAGDGEVPAGAIAYVVAVAVGWAPDDEPGNRVTLRTLRLGAQTDGDLPPGEDPSAPPAQASPDPAAPNPTSPRSPSSGSTPPDATSR